MTEAEKREVMWGNYIVLLEECTELSIAKLYLEHNDPQLQHLSQVVLEHYCGYRRGASFDDAQKKALEPLLREVIDYLAGFGYDGREGVDDIAYAFKAKSTLQFLIDDFPRLAELLNYSKQMCKIDDDIENWDHNFGHYNTWSCVMFLLGFYPVSHVWWRNCLEKCTIDGTSTAAAKKKLIEYWHNPSVNPHDEVELTVDEVLHIHHQR